LESGVTLHQFRIFAAVAKRLNVTEASRELHIGQPAVSRQLKLMQEEYGVKLYKNVGRGIELTEEGLGLLGEAEEILLRLEKIKEKLKTHSSHPKAGSLTVGGSYGPSAIFLPTILAVFQKNHPRVTLTLRTENSGPMEQLVVKSEVDIALITAPSHDPRLIVEPLRKERVVVFASVKHPLPGKGELTLAGLASAPLIVRQGSRGRGRVEEILRQIEKQGPKLNVVMRCDSPEAVKTAVKMRVGLGILHRDLVEADGMRGGLKIIRTPGLRLDGYSFIIYHAERPLSANAQEFLALLHQWPRGRRRLRGSFRAA
jgi:DNA-binding transcriptional LysR family regulator